MDSYSYSYSVDNFYLGDDMKDRLLKLMHASYIIGTWVRVGMYGVIIVGLLSLFPRLNMMLDTFTLANMHGYTLQHKQLDDLDEPRKGNNKLSNFGFERGRKPSDDMSILQRNTRDITSCNP